MLKIETLLFSFCNALKETVDVTLRCLQRAERLWFM